METKTDIGSVMKELKDLTVELKSCRKRVKELNAQKKKCESDVLSYLEQTDTPGVRHGDFVVMKEVKPQRIKQKAAEKRENCWEVLKRHGIKNPKDVFNELEETRKGKEKQEVSKLTSRFATK